ncbi:MAG: hypothetical protein ACQER9_03705 [Nanobdellota archaeon]
MKIQENKGWLFFVLVILIFVIIGIAIFSINNLINDGESANTFKEIYEKTLEGHESENNYMYNGFVFVKQKGLWQTILYEIEKDKNITSRREVKIYTHYSPEEVEDIYVEDGIEKSIKDSEKIILNYPSDLDKNIVLAGVEIGKVVGNKYGLLNKNVTNSVYGEYDGNYPILDCADSTNEKPLLKFVKADKNEIVFNETNEQCILIKGKNTSGMIKTSDKLLFDLLNIIPEN